MNKSKAKNKTVRSRQTRKKLMVGGSQFKCKSKMNNENISDSLKTLIDTLDFKNNNGEQDQHHFPEGVLSYLRFDNDFFPHLQLSIPAALKKNKSQIIQLNNYDFIQGALKYVFYNDKNKHVYAIELANKDSFKSFEADRGQYDFLNGYASYKHLSSETIVLPANKFIANPIVNRGKFIETLIDYLKGKGMGENLSRQINENVKIEMIKILEKEGLNFDINAIRQLIHQNEAGLPFDGQIDSLIKLVARALLNAYEVNKSIPNDWFWFNIRIYPNFGRNVVQSWCKNNANFRFVAAIILLMYLTYVLSMMHHMNFVHLDVKLDNILIGNPNFDNQNHITLIDFEKSIKKKDGDKSISTNITPYLKTLNMDRNTSGLYDFSELLDLDIHCVGLAIISMLSGCEKNVNIYRNIDKNTLKTQTHKEVFKDLYNGDAVSKEIFNFACDLCDYGFSKSVLNNNTMFDTMGKLSDDLKTLYKKNKQPLDDKINAINVDNVNIRQKLPDTIRQYFFG